MNKNEKEKSVPKFVAIKDRKYVVENPGFGSPVIVFTSFKEAKKKGEPILLSTEIKASRLYRSNFDGKIWQRRR